MFIIDNQSFDYDEGCRLAKMKYRQCPDFFPAKDIWDDIEPLKFSDIAKWENLEKRRIGMLYLGIDALVKEVNPKLLNKTTLKKNTTWINSKGVLESVNFKDTYELYKVDGKHFTDSRNAWRRTANDCHYVKCFCSSTKREYLIWVDIRSIYNTKYGDGASNFRDIADMEAGIDAVDAIAWTITTNLPKEYIEKIIRQGDCVLIKPTEGKRLRLENPRHLTSEEYNEFLVAES